MMNDQEFAEVTAVIEAYLASPKENPLKVRFERVITDKQIPLADRWTLFCKTPIKMCLKNHERWVQHLDTLDTFFNSAQQRHGYGFHWYNEYGADKYETVDMVEFVEEFVMNFAEGDYDQDTVMGEFVKDPARIDALKEEILAKNLGSFTMDW